ncbi:MAG: hypothetical protein JWQ38_2217 [Flavipsychrobacter sp.]|nr:hypothetical protein [Flavipsychrobacter sp.]
MKHIKGLDTIRAFAIIFVLLGHWGMPFGTKMSIGNFLKTKLIPDGTFGVDLFFVLSGFLITGILLQIKAETKQGEQLQSIKAFFMRRILRIFPVYYLTIIGLLIINYAGVREHAGYYLTFTSNILIYRTQNWGFIPHTWSLAVEEQFYLVWPWIILFIDWKYLKYVFIAAIAVSLGTSWYMIEIANKGDFPILVYNCFVCFALGGMYAWSRYTNTSYGKFERRLFPLFLVALILYFRWKFIRVGYQDHTLFLYRFVEGVISLQIIVAAVHNKSEWVRRYILENRVLNYIGIISYGIYLYHNILQPVWDGYIDRARLRHPGMPEFLYDYYGTYAEKLIILYIMCWASYRFIEKPMLKLKDRFPYKAQ